MLNLKPACCVAVKKRLLKLPKTSLSIFADSCCHHETGPAHHHLLLCHHRCPARPRGGRHRRRQPEEKVRIGSFRLDLPAASWSSALTLTAGSEPGFRTAWRRTWTWKPVTNTLMLLWSSGWRRWSLPHLRPGSTDLTLRGWSAAHQSLWRWCFNVLFFPSLGLNIRPRRAAALKAPGCLIFACVYHNLLSRLEHFTSKQKVPNAPEGRMLPSGYGRRRRRSLEDGTETPPQAGDRDSEEALPACRYNICTMA